MTVHESEWTDEDRGLALAWLDEQDDLCPTCGHPKTLCRDPATAGTWEVVQEICQPGRVAQAAAENAAEQRRRGVVISTRRTVIGG